MFDKINKIYSNTFFIIFSYNVILVQSTFQIAVLSDINLFLEGDAFVFVDSVQSRIFILI